MPAQNELVQTTGPDKESCFRFVLLCHQRSGSNALSAILNKDPNVWVYGQLFNHFADYRKRNRKRGFRTYKSHPEALGHFGRNPPWRYRWERLYLSMLPTEKSLEKMMETFWSRYRPDEDLRARGYKLHDLQVSDDDLAALATQHADGVVMLSRSNLLKVAVSWNYAMHTDIWSRRDAPGKPQPVHALDLSELEWFIEKTGKEVANWRRVLTESGANFIDLNYERDIETRELKPLYDFIGVPYGGKPEFATKRLSSPSYSHISNAQEIDTQLGSAETGRLFN